VDIGDGVLADLPPDWEAQVARAYSVFGAAGLDGADEFRFNFTRSFLSEKAKGQVRNALGLFEKQPGGTDERGRRLSSDGRPIRGRLPERLRRAPKVGDRIAPVSMSGPPGRPSASDWLTEGQPVPEPGPQPKAGLGDRLKRAGKGLAEKGLERALVPKDIREAEAEQRRLAAQVIPDGPRTVGLDPSPAFDRIATSGGMGEQRRYRLRGYPQYELIQDGGGKWHAFRGRTNIGGNYDDPSRAESDIGAWQTMRHPKQAAVVKAVEERIGGPMVFLGEYDQIPVTNPTKGAAFRGRDGALQVWTETESQPDGQWMRFDEDYFRSQGVDDPDAAGSGAVGGEGSVQSVHGRDDLGKKPDGPIKDILRWMFWPPKQEKRGRGGGGRGGGGGGGGGRRPKPDAEDAAEGAAPTGPPRDPMEGFDPEPGEDPAKPRPIDGSTPPKVHKADDGYEIEESGTSVADPPDKQPEYTARRPDGKEIGRHRTARAARRAIDEDRARAALEKSRDEFIAEHDGNSNPMVQRIVDTLKQRHDIEMGEVGRLAGEYKEYLQSLDFGSGLPVDSGGNTVTDDPLLLEGAADQIYGLVREMAGRRRAGEKPNPEKRTPESMPQKPTGVRRPKPGSPGPDPSQAPTVNVPAPAPAPAQQPGTRPPELREAPQRPASRPAPAEPPDWAAAGGPPPADFDVDDIPGIPPAQTDEQRQGRGTLRWQIQEWRNSLDQTERLPKALASLEQEKRQWAADNPAPSRQDFTGPQAAGEHRAALATWKSDKQDMEDAAADRAGRIRTSLQFNKDRAEARAKGFADGMDAIAAEGGYTGHKWWRGESAGPEAQNVPGPAPEDAPEPGAPEPGAPERRAPEPPAAAEPEPSQGEHQRLIRQSVDKVRRAERDLQHAKDHPMPSLSYFQERQRVEAFTRQAAEARRTMRLLQDRYAAKYGEEYAGAPAAPPGPAPAAPGGGPRPYSLQRGESISLTPDADGLRSVTKDGRVIKRVRNDGTVIPVAEPAPRPTPAQERENARVADQRKIESVHQQLQRAEADLERIAESGRPEDRARAERLVEERTQAMRDAYQKHIDTYGKESAEQTSGKQFDDQRRAAARGPATPRVRRPPRRGGPRT
jgi:hypothetical protein